MSKVVARGSGPTRGRDYSRVPQGKDSGNSSEFLKTLVLILQDAILVGCLLCSLSLLTLLAHKAIGSGEVLSLFDRIHHWAFIANYLLLAGRTMWRLARSPAKIV